MLLAQALTPSPRELLDADRPLTPAENRTVLSAARTAIDEPSDLQPPAGIQPPGCLR